MKSGFLDRLIERLDRLDPASLQVHFLRLAQERGLLETIFQSIQEGVIVVDREARVTYSNRASEQMIGVNLESDRGRPVARFLGEFDWDRILRFDTEEWTRIITHEIEVTYPDHRFLSFYVVPLSYQEGDGQGAVVILRDVTHVREREADMLESERLDAVKLLAAGVAHEIGNPLNALNIHLQLLEREIRRIPDEHQAELKELADVARNEVTRLDLIISQFLRALRPTKPKLLPARIDTILKESLVLLKQEIENRNIDVEIECGDALPEIRVDRDQIKQAFFNVIRNAFQAMPDGGKLTITLSASDRYLVTGFRDTGVGIKPEDFARIFEPYHTTKEKGSGLGLMIVQRIVQDHGGQVEVESKEGEGTEFTILLPLADRRMRLLKASPPRARRAGASAVQEDAEQGAVADEVPS